MNWFLLKSGSGSATFNMALDEALLEAVAGLGQPVLRFYGWTEPAATFGHLQKYCAVESATALRPLIRRPTGGGMVPHDADWTYSLAIPPNHEWYSFAATESYRRVHTWVQGAFADLNMSTELASCCRKPVIPGQNPLIPGACFVGHEKFDLLWHGKKIAGAAQRRNKCGLLIQGSVQPPLPLARADWEAAMLETGRKEFGADWVEWSAYEVFWTQVNSLIREKYSQESYNRKR
jgi:lipoate-protein ligase A